MPDLTKTVTMQAQSKYSLGLRELIAIAVILELFAALQMLYVAKHPVTFAAILAPAAFGIIAP
jgi:hypothetical protein